MLSFTLHEILLIIQCMTICVTEHRAELESHGFSPTDMQCILCKIEQEIDERDDTDEW